MNEINEIYKIERNVLDAYFSTRVNNAPPPSQSNLFVADNKTTLEIVEALDSTYPLTQQDVVSYMTEHGFLLEPDESGVLIWKIWRLR